MEDLTTDEKKKKSEHKLVKYVEAEVTPSHIEQETTAAKLTSCGRESRREGGVVSTASSENLFCEKSDIYWPIIGSDAAEKKKNNQLM